MIEFSSFFLAPVKPQELIPVKKLIKNGYYPRIFTMDNRRALGELRKLYKAGDSIIIHASGEPLEMSAEGNERRYRYNPYELANFFNQLFPTQKDKETKLEIDLRFCNSGTAAKFEKYCFSYAEELSLILTEMGFKKAVVHGYTGYIHAKNAFKLSVAGSCGHGAKEAHCRLEDAKVTYENGLLITPPSKFIIEEYSYKRKHAYYSAEFQRFFDQKEKLNPIKKLAEDFKAHLKIAAEQRSFSPIIFSPLHSPIGTPYLSRSNSPFCAPKKMI